ncbi:DUF4198 domain-containing protein [Bowmanella dokdonensis]|uniref:DUF4198 domain-containing protein n=1 Tax=Bowmanella dokdonensis TaxID=751969 RepID=A0A939DMQ3_9ALTE|nr:DUF4198 domain-containing protein [Bowmanella dokdonensis]MBN7825440.1 DUF4198 domain-containing protein [Bowmanella dokdonensis]
MLLNPVKVIVIAAMLLASQAAFAHARWIVPSHTNLSGDEIHKIAVDFSISNDIFHPDMSFGSAGDPRSPQLVLNAPDGSRQAKLPFVDLLRKSAAGLTLTQSGTYRIGLEQPPVLLTFFKQANGERGRIFGGKGSPDLPQGATDLFTTRMHVRVETFVSRNQLNALVPQNQGLELGEGTHPNDLFTGEPVTWQLILDGKPVGADLDVTLIRGDSRYRNIRDVIRLKTDQEGRVSLSFDEPGLYLLESSLDSKSQAEGIDNERAALFVTLEVNPA